MSGSSSNNPAAGSNIVNPHNPEFLTKKPWYLGGQGQDEPTLDHQSGIVSKSRGSLLEQEPLSLTATEEQLEAQRRAEREQTKFFNGQWVEALKKKKLPYRICQILAVNKQQTEFDLQYEDGTIERKVRLNSKAFRPAVRMTKTGSRSAGGAGGAETYDGKRDAYHGYDKDSHNVKMTAKFEQREELRRKLRKGLKEDDDKASDDDKKNNKKKSAKDDDDSDFSDSDDDDKNGDEFVQRDEDDKVITTRLARQGGVGGAQMKVTARNLRIREDTAKYLRNLDPNSAYYDPKSRSMRDNPHPELDPLSQTNFAGDNFSRISGDAVHLAETQLFAWDAAQKGVAEIHPQANPSQAELLKRQFQTKATDLQLQQKKAVLDKYGGAEYLDGRDGLASAIDMTRNDGSTSNISEQQQQQQHDKKPAAADRKLRFGVSTTEEKYGRDAAASSNKSMKRQAIPCKYEEDVFINGHSTVWGSYFHKGAFMWGYADDHSLLKLSYCTGQAGKLANDEANEMRYGTGQAGSAALAQARGMLSAQQKIAAGNASSNKKLEQVVPNRSKLYGEANQNADLDQEKVHQALERAKKKQQKDGSGSNAADSNEQGLDTERDDRKRKYHSIKANDQDMTEEDMEAYRLQKDRSEDPMANLASDDADKLLEYK